MSEIRELWSQLRIVFSLVPWRMRPKLIAILVGSTLVALSDMAAIALILPVTLIATGTKIEQSDALALIARILGIESESTLLMVVLIIIVALMIIKNVATFVFRWWSVGIMAHAQADASYAVMKLYADSPWLEHRKRSPDSVYQSLNVYVASCLGLASSVIMLLTDSIAVLAILFALLLVSPLATLVAVVFFGGSAFMLQWVMRTRMIRFGEEARIANLTAWSHLGPAVGGFKEARLANAQETFARDYATARRQAALANRAVGVLGESPRYALEVIMILGVLVLAGTLFAATSEGTTLAFLGVFMVAAVRIIPTLNRVIATLGGIRGNRANLDAFTGEVTTLRREGGRRAEPEQRHAFPPADIVIDHVTFQFPDADAPVLSDVSHTIRAGHTIALVGASGAGKTTLVELLLALLEPVHGSITVDGVSIHDHPVSWRDQLGVVVQDVFLLDATVKENVIFGHDPAQVDDERLRRAIQDAELTETVAGFPAGLDTVVGSNGTRLSGGQRQRIGIARALYRNPQVLILDEATSALDNETEARVTQTIKDLQGSRTIIVVAHRLSTVKHADQILFFERGRLAASGTMEELVARNARFAELVRLGNLT